MQKSVHKCGAPYLYLIVVIAFSFFFSVVCFFFFFDLMSYAGMYQELPKNHNKCLVFAHT